MTEHTSADHSSPHHHEPEYQPPAVATPLQPSGQLVTTTYSHHQNNQPASAFAITSLILGIISLTGPGLLTGIPAIILGAIALKKHQGGKGLSLAGVITGSLGTFVSILYIAFLIVVFIIALSNDSSTYPTVDRSSPSTTYQSL